MEWASTLGQMVEATWVNTKTIRNMDMESINGLTEDCTLVNGNEENNMDSVSTEPQKLHLNMVYGKRENVLNGLTKRLSMKLIVERKTLDAFSRNKRIKLHLFTLVLKSPTISIISYIKSHSGLRSLLITLSSEEAA